MDPQGGFARVYELLGPDGRAWAAKVVHKDQLATTKKRTKASSFPLFLAPFLISSPCFIENPPAVCRNHDPQIDGPSARRSVPGSIRRRRPSIHPPRTLRIRSKILPLSSLFPKLTKTQIPEHDGPPQTPQTLYRTRSPILPHPDRVSRPIHAQMPRHASGLEVGECVFG